MASPFHQICSVCAVQQDKMPLSVREWTCPACGTDHDRDVNAARNLQNMAVSSTVAACGPAMRPAMEEGSGLRRKTKTKPASVKQEVSFVPV